MNRTFNVPADYGVKKFYEWLEPKVLDQIALNDTSLVNNATLGDDDFYYFTKFFSNKLFNIVHLSVKYVILLIEKNTSTSKFEVLQFVVCIKLIVLH